MKTHTTNYFEGTAVLSCFSACKDLRLGRAQQ